MAEKHDQAYGKLLRLKEFAIDAVKLCLPKFITDLFDFSTMTRLAGKFITSKYTSRYSDLIWKIKMKEQNCYICILYEIQSYTDHWMAVRIHEYIALILQALIESGEIKDGEPLPFILPIVIYTGKERWKSATNVRSLFMETPKFLDQYKPEQRYILLDMLHDRRLAKIRNNLFAIVARLEQAQQRQEITNIFKDLFGLVQKDARQHIIVRIFRDFLGYVFSKKHHKYVQIKGDNLMAVQQNYADKWDKFVANLEAKGEAKGMKKGKVLGIQEGKVLGIKEGKVLGIQEGKVLGMKKGEVIGVLKEKLDTATRLLKKDCDLSFIKEVTGLSLKKIRALAKEIQTQ